MESFEKGEPLKTYKTLVELVEQNLEAISEGKLRPYKVTPQEGETVYALANSQGNAALALCEVEACTQKQIQAAALNALLEKAKADDSKLNTKGE